MTDLRLPINEELIEFQNNSVRYALQRKKTLIADEPGLGKGHPLTTRILTPDGYTPVGKISPRDHVIGSNGKPVLVTGVFDRGVLPVYKVTTDDGASTLVDGDHLWTVHDDESDEWVTINTMEVMGRIMRGISLTIPTMTGPAEFHPIPDYNGFEQAVYLFAKPGTFTEPTRMWPISTAETAGVHQRLEWLRGAIKSGGRVRGDGHIRILVPRWNEALYSTLRQVVRSIGGLLHTKISQRQYRVEIYIPDDLWRPVIGITRKKLPARWKHFVTGVPARRIIDVVPAGSDHVRCISVASEDHLYVTEEHLVTHNTVSALTVGNNIGEVRSMLIICLASHKIHWQRAVERWDLNGLSVGIAEGDYLPDTECVIINYDILYRHYYALRAGVWDIMICDEAHFLQNAESRRTLNIFGGKKRVEVGGDAPDEDKNGDLVEKKAKKGTKKEWRYWDPIVAKREVYLTGTPIPNRVKNLWPLIKRIDPRGLGRNYDAFAERYCAAYETGFGMDDNGSSNEEELNFILKDRFMIRHLKMEVLKDLPPKVRQIIPLASEGLQKKVQAEKDAVAALLAAYEEKMGVHVDLDEMSLAELVMKARPVMLEEYAETADGDLLADTPLNKLAIARRDLALAKVPMVIEYVSNLMNQGYKVVIFAYHRDVIAALKERWSNSCAVIFGGTPTHKRQAEADRFQNDPDCNPFIGQYTAAGTGYTLTTAHQWVGAEMTWLPHELTQAEDRVHRIGQLDTVFAQHLIVEGSMDEGMFGKIVAKQRIIDKVLN